MEQLYENVKLQQIRKTKKYKDGKESNNIICKDYEGYN